MSKFSLKFKIGVALLIIVLTALIAIPTFQTAQLAKLPEIQYTEFLDKLENNEIIESYYSFNALDFIVVDKDGNQYKVPNPQRTTLREEMLLKNVDLKVDTRMSTLNFVQIVSSMIPIVLLIVFIVYIVIIAKATQGTNSEATQEDNKNTDAKVTWDDLILSNEQIGQLQELVKVFTEPEKFKEVGAQLPTGVLFYGPPGTGKTLSAQAIANAAGVNFISVSGSSFIEMFVGLGASRVRKLFNRAIKQAPCVVFIDEIDALGKRNGGQTSHFENDQTVGELLTQMSRIAKSNNILVIGATNLPDTLDPALKRSGRFDIKVSFELPTARERLKLLELYTQNKKLSPEISLSDLSKMLIGFTGADIESLFNRAAISSVTNGSDLIGRSEIDEAMIQMATHGVTRKDDSEVSQEILEITSIHEAGHATAVKLLTNDLLYRVSVRSVTSGAGGYTMHIDQKEILHSRRDLENKVMIIYAGRAAEYIFTGSDDLVSTGASSDITAATNVIEMMITHYGMSQYGMIDPTQLQMDIGHNTLPVAQEISRELYNKTVKLLQDNWVIVREVQLALIENRVLLADDLDKIFSKFESCKVVE